MNLILLHFLLPLLHHYRYKIRVGELDLIGPRGHFHLIQAGSHQVRQLQAAAKLDSIAQHYLHLVKWNFQIL